MKASEIVMKYHNQKMLLTLDLNMFVCVLLDTFGESINIKFEPMSIDEQNQSSKVVDGLRAVTDRFWVFECMESGTLQRRNDLEEKIVREGIK